ncbi:uncharacterized protein LOC117344563 isoform X2 [Pecten maximus]|uniref:uncharacterized protein LOC117344563 isoform X2 n=1 Tax=Pecten maximus TaxID=6579 RepID=UPI0014583D5F|nr:uncharacterized protein LOC117344563 isoform X2 [Pecten maximus]
MAAQYQFSKETVNFMQITRALLDVVPDVFRKLLLSRLPPSGLGPVLWNKKGQILSLLTNQQKKMLFPQGGVFAGSLKDLDTSLLYILLRNLGNIPPHQNGWGRVPNVADRSLSANIARLRIQRNEAFAYTNTASLSDEDLKIRWAVIRQSVEDIENNAFSTRTFVAELDSILTMTVDSSTEKNFNVLAKELEASKMAAQYQFSKETVNFIRITKAFVGVVPDVFRELLLSRLPPSGLGPVLWNQKGQIFSLLNNQQKKMLFPQGGVFGGSIKYLDISLLYILLRNLGNIPPHQNGWGRVPDVADRSLSANIDRLRIQRNEAYGHAKAASLSDGDLKIRWAVIRQSVEDIENNALSTMTFVAELDSILTMTVDSSTEKNFNVLAKELEEKNEEQQQQEFTARISENEDRPCNITITVIGHKGVGKSCFVKQIKEEYILEGGPGSTDTADLYVNYLAFNPNTRFRKKLDENGEVETGRQRLKRIIDRYRKGDNLDIQKPVQTEPSQSSPMKISEVQRKRKSLANSSHSEEIKHVKLSSEHRNVIEEVMHTEIEESDKQMKGFITIYDFGGEKVFYNTHHCFMSSNMVFVLVFDVAMCLDTNRSKDGYESIENWLRSIATYAVDKAAHGEGTPPVIIVGSHLDEVSPDEKEQEEAFSAVLEELYKNPQLREIMEIHVQEMYPIANLNDSSKHKRLFELVWQKIIDVAPLQSQWEKPVPARWMAFEHYLVKRKRKNTGSVILTYEELLEINRESAVPLAEHEILDFLKNLRLVGPFLCFELHGKRPFIVLHPQWIVDAFKAIITAPDFTVGLSMKLKLQWKQFQKSGEIKIDLIQKLWERHKDSSFLSNFETLYSVMETLGLLANPLSDNEKVEYFIVPSMLRTADPNIIQPILNHADTVTTVTLCLKFDNPFIPQAVWDKMIAACIHKFRPLNEHGHDGSNFIQRSFVCLSVDSLWNMIINCSENIMKITMFKKDTDKSVPTGAGVKLLGDLQFHLKRILELNHQSHLKYQFYLHNDYRFTAKDKMVKADDLIQTPRLQCHSLNETQWIEREHYHIWFKCPDQKNSMNETRIKEIHAEMIRKLSAWIDLRLPETWKTFQTCITPYLDHVDVYGSQIKCLDDICRTLIGNGSIGYGKYDKLRSVAEKIHDEAVKIIDEASSEINDIQGFVFHDQPQTLG